MRQLLIAFVLAACSSSSKPITTTPPGGSAASGTLSGSVSLIGTQCAQPGPGCEGPAAGYELVVYAADATTVAGKTTTAADGKFSLSLPEGKYVLLTPAGPTEKKRTEVTVSRDALSEVKLDVDTGVR